MYDRYNVGDLVKVIHGPLEGPKVVSCRLIRDGACPVETVFFGRPTPVDVEFSEIERI
jgi:transcription antitermination factor NusG